MNKTIKLITGSGALVIATLCSLLILELCLRQLPVNAIKPPHWAAVQINYPICLTLDKHVIYKPISQLVNIEGCAATDTLGFRVQPNDPRGGPKIVFLGDSFTFGAGVKDDETYPYVIQEKFNQESIQTQIYNAGVIGYGTDQELLLLKKHVLPYLKPDIVVLNIYENDYHDNNQACLFDIKNNAPTQRSAQLNTIYILGSIHSKMPQFVKSLKIYRLFLSAFPERWSIGCTKKINDSEADWPDNYRKMKLLLQEFQILAKQQSFKLVVTYFQSQFAYDHSRGHLSEDYFRWTNNNIIELNKVLQPIIISKEILQKTNIANMSYSGDTQVMGANDANLAYDLFLMDDPLDFGYKHMNAKGNLKAAEVVYPMLKELVVATNLN